VESSNARGDVTSRRHQHTTV